MNRHQTLDNSLFTQMVMNRLLEQYLARCALPNADSEPYTIRWFHRLCRLVLLEGYGHDELGSPTHDAATTRERWSGRPEDCGA